MLCLISGVLLLRLCAWADPVLPTLFSDHMVLQQGRDILVWGKAEPGETITANLAGHSGNAIANPHGEWSLHLPSMKAGGPFTLVIHGRKDVIIKDVMIGEVWIASGQSNMTFSVGGVENAATQLPEANNTQIRLFNVPKKIALTPQENTLPAHWEVCMPDTAKSFSAVAYFFAREIQRKLNVPVGVVESAWPGTTIQTWIAAETLRADPQLKNVTDEWDRATLEQKRFADSQSGYGDVCTSPSQSNGDSGSDATAGSGHESNSILEVCHAVNCMRVIVLQRHDE